jgi:hypothetical protein
MNDKDAVIADLRAKLEQVTLERDKWVKIAKTLADYSCSQAHAYYGRTVEYALEHAEQNS